MKVTSSALEAQSRRVRDPTLSMALAGQSAVLERARSVLGLGRREKSDADARRRKAFALGEKGPADSTPVTTPPPQRLRYAGEGGHSEQASCACVADAAGAVRPQWSRRDAEHASACLCSDGSQCFTGTTYVLDGGMTLHHGLAKVPDRYDVIVVGSGPGGAALAQRLAPSGKRILILERGDYLPRETQNWSSSEVFVHGRYQATETWYGKNGESFHPGLHYYVGGNSKVYGAALLRFRERDFEAVVHGDGVSPEWPLKYGLFEPYYAEAERLFHVHGQRGEDPSEPAASGPFPHEAVAHEPRIQTLHEQLSAHGVRPFHLPLGILLDQKDGVPTRSSACIRCDAFDGFPCPLDAKADAQVICIDPMIASHPNVTLLRKAFVSRLETDATGRSIGAVHVTRNGVEERYSADIVVVACGALSSALLLLRSASELHPHGLANGSDQVGRNYMRHNQSVLMALSKEINDTVFQKTLALSDYYFGADDWPWPHGLIQMTAKTHADDIRGEALPSWLEWLPDTPFEMMARHAMDFWLSSEDLPRPENRIRLDGEGRVVLEVTPNNMEAHQRLRGKLEMLLQGCGLHPHLMERKLYFGKNIPIGGTAHQAGTARFGTDPANSVLDLNCRAHELDNLYLADASFFPSIAAVNPTLTIVANALRVADHIAGRLA